MCCPGLGGRSGVAGAKGVERWELEAAAGGVFWVDLRESTRPLLGQRTRCGVRPMEEQTTIVSLLDEAAGSPIDMCEHVTSGGQSRSVDCAPRPCWPLSFPSWSLMAA
jgi:hypothetical protein